MYINECLSLSRIFYIVCLCVRVNDELRLFVILKIHLMESESSLLQIRCTKPQKLAYRKGCFILKCINCICVTFLSITIVYTSQRVMNRVVFGVVDILTLQRPRVCSEVLHIQVFMCWNSRLVCVGGGGVGLLVKFVWLVYFC